MATLQYFIRTKAKDKLVNIRCRLRAGRDVDLLASTGIVVLPEHWSIKQQKVKELAEIKHKDKLNKKLRLLRDHILSEFTVCSEPTGDWLNETIDKYNNPDKYKAKEKNLFNFIRDFIAEAPNRKQKSGKPVGYKTIREYNRTLYYLEKYVDAKKVKLDFNDITLDFYYNFINYLESENLSVNTIGNKICTLKTFLNAATDLGINKNLQFRSKRFAVISEDSESIYLSERELSTIYKLDLPKDLVETRDLFIVGCWTGLRFGNWADITKENIKNSFLKVKQKKTGNPVTIPLHETVKEIINKYDGNLPKIKGNKKFNEDLKDIAKLAKLKEPVKITITKGGITRTTTYEKWQLVMTHCARRSFATNLYLIGVPSLTIMAITGHKTEAAFLRYIKVTPDEHAQKLLEIWNRQSMKVANQ